MRKPEKGGPTAVVRSLLTLAAGVGIYLAAVRLIGQGKALAHLAQASRPLLVVTLLLAAGSILPYAALLRLWAARMGVQASFPLALASALAGAAAGRSLPAGGLANLATQGWYLGRRGERERALGAALLAGLASYQGLLTAVGLGAALTLPSWPGGAGSGLLVAISCLLLSGLWAATLARRGIRRRISWVARRFSPRLAQAAMALEEAEMPTGPRGLLLDLTLATLRWVLEAAALRAALLAVGGRLSPGRILASYALSNAAATLPIAPGGLGLVESSLAISLARWGLPLDLGLAGVMVYRAITFWLPWLAGLPVVARTLSRRR